MELDIYIYGKNFARVSFMRRNVDVIVGRLYYKLCWLRQICFSKNRMIVYRGTEFFVSFTFLLKFVKDW